MALDSAGNPVVSYLGGASNTLKVLHCNDPNCSGGDESITSPDTGVSFGEQSSLALDSTGNPIVSYQRGLNNTLKVLHCNDPNCSGGDESITSPDVSGPGGTYSSLALDSSGYPVVSYSGANSILKVLHCGSAICGDAKPTPTPTSAPTLTPCPPGGCLDLNFLIAVAGCDSSRGYNKCYVPADTDFTADVILQGISALPNGAYTALGFTVAYEGMISNGTATMVWPHCVFGAPKSLPGGEGYGCAIGIGAPSSTYTGVVGRVSLGCHADGSVSLIHSGADTLIIDDKGVTQVEDGPDVLFIKCDDGTPRPTATPLPPKDPDADTDGDTVPNGTDLDDDGDGCPDEAENGFNEMQGGRRDPHNPWDYFNPTNDGKNRVDDILTLVNHYYLAEGDPGYDEKYDRTSIPETAKEPWRLGPPSGQILVDDILNILGSYRHDCGTGIVK
jgi:hypothetical protein